MQSIPQTQSSPKSNLNDLGMDWEAIEKNRKGVIDAY